MKKVLLLLIVSFTLSLTAQEYGFGIISDYNTTGNPYEFTFVATPDFTNPSPNFADIQITLAVSAGNTIEASSFTEILGSGWQVNTALTGAVIQGPPFNVGDGSKDLWIFTLPVPTSALTISHIADESIPFLSFIVDNMPNTGVIEILENSDPIATGLAGVGFVVDNLINANLNEGNGVMDYFGGFTPGSSSFMFDILSTNDINDLGQIYIYPNPTKNDLFVKCNDDYNYEIIDINGRVLVNGTIKSAINQISLKDIPSGLYFLKLSNSQGNHTEKIMVN